MSNYNIDELIKENEALKSEIDVLKNENEKLKSETDILKNENEDFKKELKEVQEQKAAYIKKSEYLSKELKKNEKGTGHLGTLEIVTDLALTLCVALLITIVTYTSGAYGEGFFELIKNSFAWIFK